MIDGNDTNSAYKVGFLDGMTWCMANPSKMRKLTMDVSAIEGVESLVIQASMLFGGHGSKATDWQVRPEGPIDIIDMVCSTQEAN